MHWIRAGKQQQNRDYTHRTSGYTLTTHTDIKWQRGLEVKKGAHKHSYEAESKHRGQLCFAVYLDHLLALCDNISWVLWGTLNRKDTQETWEVQQALKEREQFGCDSIVTAAVWAAVATAGSYCPQKKSESVRCWCWKHHWPLSTMHLNVNAVVFSDQSSHRGSEVIVHM